MPTPLHLINEDNRLCHRGVSWLACVRWFTVGVTVLLVGDAVLDGLRLEALVPKSAVAAAGIALALLYLGQLITACGLTIYLQRVQRLRLEDPLYMPGWLLVVLSLVPLIGLIAWSRLLVRILELADVAPRRRLVIWAAYWLGGLLPFVQLAADWLITHRLYLPRTLQVEDGFLLLNALWLAAMVVTAYATCAAAETVFTVRSGEPGGDGQEGGQP